MKVVTRGQALEVSARVATQVNWDAIDGDMLQNQLIGLTAKEFGERFTIFLKNGGRVIISEPKIINIDRINPFDPVAFIGEGWSIWRGPPNGDGLSGEEVQDERSLKLGEVDLTKIRLETTLKVRETSVAGEEKLKRLIEQGYIRLDAKVLQTLWGNQYLIPEAWKQSANGNMIGTFFDGTILRDSDGGRYVLCLCWFGGQWLWYRHWLEGDWGASSPSAVLAG